MKPNTNTILADAWRDYEIKIIPLNAPDVQRVECRRAFYAGARSLFHAIVTVLEPGLEPTEADLKAMDNINAELERFLVDIQTGKA